MKTSGITKKIILFGLIPVIAIVIGLFASSFLSSKANYGNEFQTSSDVLLKYNGTSEVVVVPNGIRTIGQSAFENNPLISEVILPSSIEKIETSAFSGCSSLRKIEIPGSIVSIGDSAFYGCKNLEDVSIGASLRNLGNGVFSGCENLDDISIDPFNEFFICMDGVIYSKDQKTLYQYLPGLKNQYFVIPDVVEEVKRYSFWGADAIKDLTVSAGMRSVNDYAFANMLGLENVTIQEPTSSIEIGAFDNDINLHQIIMPVSMLDIRSNSFAGCPDDLTFVCDGNSKAHSFAVENSINATSEPIYKVVFTEVSNDNHSDSDNFSSGIANADYSGSGDVNDNKTSESGDDSNSSTNHHITGNNSANIEGTLIDETAIVSDRAYIVLGDMSVREISEDTAILDYSDNIPPYAYYCTALTSFDIRAEYPVATSIGDLAFARSAITGIDIPDGITSIGYGAFYHCDNLSDVIIPSSVNSIDGCAFEYTAWYNNWKNTSNDDYLIVGDGVLVSYKGDEQVISLPNEIKHISQYAFKDHTELIAVTLNPNLNSIASESFYGCENLANIVGLSNNMVIDSDAFAGCKYSE